jgi:hypothetical protein
MTSSSGLDLDLLLWAIVVFRFRAADLEEPTNDCAFGPQLLASFTRFRFVHRLIYCHLVDLAVCFNLGSVHIRLMHVADQVE